MQPIIELEAITKAYPMGDVRVPVLKGVSLAIDRGELVALTGASGSGKSTLMNILGCLDRHDGGVYRLDGTVVSKLLPPQLAGIRNRRLGFVFQNFNLLPRTSAIDNVALPLAYAPENLSGREVRRRAAEMLRRVGLGDRLTHEPSRLSGGQQQRVAIARALVNRPPLLLADEPTGNLDSRTGEAILAMLETLNRVDGITIVMVTHDAHVAARAHRIIRLHDGAIVDPAALSAEPATGEVS